ncbi:hypothetical protein VTN96DRAFT_9493 [Rasamsonia emersonii]
MFNPYQPLPMLYQQQRDPTQRFRSLPYIYDWQQTPFPLYVGAVIPPAVARQLEHVRAAASAASSAIRTIDRLWRKRYHFLCPSTNAETHAAHVRAINLLVKWKEAFQGPGGRGLHETLAPPPKIPAYLVSDVTIDEKTYHEFFVTLTHLREQYLQGAHMQWMAAKRNLEELLIDAPISEMDRHNWLRWWVSYLGKMKVWELRVQEMVPPSWDEICAEVSELVEMAVDMTGSLDEELSLPVTDATF